MALTRKGPILRTGRLRNKGKRRFPKGSDPYYLAWIRSRPCVLWGGFACQGDTEAHHVKSKGAGGTDRQTVPLCQLHHREGHDHGWQTFQRRHGVDLMDAASALSETYDEEEVDG